MQRNLFGSPIGMYGSEIAKRAQAAGLWPRKGTSPASALHKSQSLEFLAFFEESYETMMLNCQTDEEVKTFVSLADAYFDLAAIYRTSEQMGIFARQLEGGTRVWKSRTKELQRVFNEWRTNQCIASARPLLAVRERTVHVVVPILFAVVFFLMGMQIVATVPADAKWGGYILIGAGVLMFLSALLGAYATYRCSNCKTRIKGEESDALKVLVCRKCGARVSN